MVPALMLCREDGATARVAAEEAAQVVRLMRDVFRERKEIALLRGAGGKDWTSGRC